MSGHHESEPHAATPEGAAVGGTVADRAYAVSQTVVSMGSSPCAVSGPLDNSLRAPPGRDTSSGPRLVMTRTGSRLADALTKATTCSEYPSSQYSEPAPRPCLPRMASIARYSSRVAPSTPT